MKASIRGPKTQYDYCPDRRAYKTQETEIVGIRVKHTCIGKRAASARAHQLVKIGQSTRRIEKREPKLPYAATNAMAEDISRENAQLS
jgi:hypothetical protein